MKSTVYNENKFKNLMYLQILYEYVAISDAIKNESEERRGREDLNDNKRGNKTKLTKAHICRYNTCKIQI